MRATCLLLILIAAIGCGDTAEPYADPFEYGLDLAKAEELAYEGPETYVTDECSFARSHAVVLATVAAAPQFVSNCEENTLSAHWSLQLEDVEVLEGPTLGSHLVVRIPLGSAVDEPQPGEKMLMSLIESQRNFLSPQSVYVGTPETPLDPSRDISSSDEWRIELPASRGALVSLVENTKDDPNRCSEYLSIDETISRFQADSCEPGMIYGNNSSPANAEEEEANARSR